MIDHLLKQHGYNLKDRLGVYATATAGALAPIVWTRYTALNWVEGGSDAETIAWIGSGVVSLPLAIIGGITGIIAGTAIVAAIKACNKNIESKIEEKAK